ncbi:hypothetical protein NP233_g9910 [Leucocoprinus birnbaumii]|uniref:Uncharacterized protein n=1 Tax=Leucocoprinus birnbaumii TaxID=56174 RepID=A0AAD5VJK0_9AGAR|nr:hypothetical protein NP233_g9910 [Leucocoprinus birnbaumii]
MSASPKDQQDDAADRQSIDELDEPQPEVEKEGGTTETTENPPVKRGRGRPKGSKNKKTTASAPGATTTTPSVPRKRGRPPKPKTEQEGEPAPKRPRGRPPKNPKPAATEGGEGAAASGETAAEPSTKRKPGRPKKAAS